MSSKVDCRARARPTRSSAVIGDPLTTTGSWYSFRKACTASVVTTGGCDQRSSSASTSKATSALGYLERGAQLSARVTADPDVERRGVQHPVSCDGVPVAALSRSHGELANLRLSCREADPAESLQLADRARRRPVPLVEIELHDLVCLAAPGVGDLDRDRDGVLGSDGVLVDREVGVAER